MSLFPWRPLGKTFDLDRQLDDAFNQLINNKWGPGSSPGDWNPAIDIYEFVDAYVIEADLPGVAPENLDITINDHDHWVTICGRRQSTTWKQQVQGTWLERQHGEFCRRFRLDHSVDKDHIQVQQQHGIFLIRLPKKSLESAAEPPVESPRQHD